MNHLVLKAKHSGEVVRIRLTELTGFVQADADSDVVGEDSFGRVLWLRKGDLTDIEVEECVKLTR